MEKDLLGQCQVVLKIWGPNIKGLDHHMTKYGQKCSFGATTLFSFGRNFYQWKAFIGAAFLKSWRSKVTVTIQPSMGQNAVWEPCAHRKGGFWRPMYDLSILSQPAGGGIPWMFWHQILSSSARNRNQNTGVGSVFKWGTFGLMASEISKTTYGYSRLCIFMAYLCTEGAISKFQPLSTHHWNGVIVCYNFQIFAQ